MFTKFIMLSLSLLTFFVAGYSDITSEYSVDLITLLFLANFSSFLFVNILKGTICFSSFAFLFICLNFLYVFIGPVLTFYFGLSFFSNNRSYESDVYVYNASLISFTLIIILFTFFLKESRGEKFNSYFNRHNTVSGRKVTILYFISCLIAFITISTFMLSGLYHLSFSGQDRIAIKDYVDVDFWYSIGSVVSVFSCFVFTNYSNCKTNKFHVYAVLLITSIYYLIDLSVGGRKFLLYFIIVALFTLSQTGKLSLKKTIYIAMPVILAMFSRGVMDKVTWGERDVVGIISGYVGEFIFPNLTGSITIFSDLNSCNFFESPINPYFSWITYYIPRVIFEDKPYSVAYNLSSYMNAGMGFALTPLTESFCALESLGPYIYPIILTFICYIVYRLSKNYTYLYIILVSMVMDINRGEISYFINNIIFMFFVWYFLEKINKVK